MESSVLNKIIELSAWTIRVRSCIKKDIVKINLSLKNLILPIIRE